MKAVAIISTIASIIAVTQATSAKVNFYSDTSCRNFIGSRFIDYDSSQHDRTYHTGGPSGSRGGLFVDTNGLGLAYRGFSNHADGSSPFTGNVPDGTCIGTFDGVYAVITTGN